MRRWGSMILAAACLAGTTGSAGHAMAAGQSTGSVQLAQVCGWFAIYHCSRTVQDARRVASTYGGFVIDSGSPQLPNFRPGWYCTVDGPTSLRQAQASAARARREGFSTAYVKNSC